MTDAPKIPAFKVTLLDAADRKVAEREFTAGPTGDDEALLRLPFGRETYIAARLKTLKGHVYVTSRAPNSFVMHAEAQPQKDVFVDQPNRGRYRVTVEALPEARWAAAAVIDFKPPATQVRRVKGGWEVEFRPNQYPCVLTCAAGKNGMKNEALPLAAFPTKPRYVSGTVFVDEKLLGGVNMLRLGVRGAGMAVTVALPDQGALDVDVALWKGGGPAQPNQLQDAYVMHMYGEQQVPPRYGK